MIIKIDLKKLSKHCIKPKYEYRILGKNLNKKQKIGGELIYINNDSNILGVAHLDNVQHIGQTILKNDTIGLDGDKITINPKLDNRLGVYILLDLLPSLGINLDILLTDNEEWAQSTASDFNPKKQYNWIVEFDRAGNDCVTYTYNDSQWKSLLKSYSFKMGIGTYTDICELQHLNVKGLNVGIGMHNYHNREAYFSHNELISNIQKFYTFYQDNCDTKYYHEEVYRYAYSSHGNYDYGRNVMWSKESGICEECNVKTWSIMDDKYICPNCQLDVQKTNKTQKYDYLPCIYCGEKTSLREDINNDPCCNYCTNHIPNNDGMLNCEYCLTDTPKNDTVILWESVICKYCASMFDDNVLAYNNEDNYNDKN